MRDNTAITNYIKRVHPHLEECLHLERSNASLPQWGLPSFRLGVAEISCEGLQSKDSMNNQRTKPP